MSRLPRLIDAAVLRANASPTDTVCMRVELRGVPSNVPYRLAGKGIQRYLLTYDPEQHAHILDVPVSLWMENRENLARDIMGGPHSSKLVVLSAPWNKAAKTPEAAPEPILDDQDDQDDQDGKDIRTPAQKAIDALGDLEEE